MPCKQKSGWCAFCGLGGACCRAGAEGPKECRGYGGLWRHECVRVPAPASGQCGGRGWKGAVSCVPGYRCDWVSAEYAECSLALAAANRLCAAAYQVCGGWHANAPWQTCCPAGYRCTAFSVGIGMTESRCLPETLQHAGEECLSRCKVEGDCAWCGQGHACCANHGLPECRRARHVGFGLARCMPVENAPLVKHQGQDCGPHCRGEGPCAWCGENNACGPVNGSHDLRCGRFSLEKHQDEDCWHACGEKGGYCPWCGANMACCRFNSTHDPFECFGAHFSRKDRHICVQPAAELSLAMKGTPTHQGQDCWYQCGGSGFCDWCGPRSACCRFGARFDKEECSGATEFSSREFHVCVAVPAVINKVELSGGLRFNGQRLVLNGVAGAGTHLSAARRAGATAVRTWSLQQSIGAFQAASAEGLKVAAGIYVSTFKDKYQGEFCELQHPWWMVQLREIIGNVTKYRNEPSLLWWQIGNELELQIDWAGGSECLWRRLEWIAQHVKIADPNHPVGTAIAGFHKVKVGRLNWLCPSLDFLGLNVYAGDALHVPAKLDSAGWDRPYALTEFAAAGAWMTPRTAWGSAVEPTSTQKALTVKGIHEECLSHDRCLGTFLFMWGWKWEHTPTWFSTFNEWRAAGGDEPSSDLVQAMQEVWTKQPPAHPAPQITAVKVWTGSGPEAVPVGFVAEKGAKLRLELSAIDPPNDDFMAWEDNEVVWLLTDDKGQTSATVIHDAVHVCPGGPRDHLIATIDTSRLADGGAYRIYAFVRDKASASGSQSCELPVDGGDCDQTVRWIMTEGTNLHSDWYPGLSPASSYRDVQHFVHRNLSTCPPPCPKRSGVTEAHMNIPFKLCGTAVGRCRAEMKKLGSQYPHKSDKELQEDLHRWSSSLCPAPCDLCEDASADSHCGQAIAKQMRLMREPLTAPFSGTSMWSSYSELQSVLQRYGKDSCPQPCPLRIPASVQGHCPR
ncbi:unnamed protein product [Effrenium voratum]|nr:unnamed protein product [Effrenium voratum]